MCVCVRSLARSRAESILVYGCGRVGCSLFRKKRLYREAKKHFEDQRLEDTERCSLKLLELAQKSKDAYFQKLAHEIAAKAQHELEKHRESLHNLEQLLALPHHPRDEQHVRTWAYNGMGVACDRLGDHARAIEFYRQELQGLTKQGDKRGQRQAHGDIGAAHAALGQHVMAIEHFTQQLDLAQELGDKRGQGQVHGDIGAAHAALGQHKMAIEHFTQQLDLAKELGDKHSQGQTHSGFGAAHVALGQHKMAIEHFTQQLGLAKELNDKRGQGQAHGDIGAAHVALGQHKMAVEHFTQQLGLAKELGDKRGQRQAHGDIGAAYATLGEDKPALEHFRQQLRVLIELGDKRGQEQAHGGVATACAALGQNKTAVKHFIHQLDLAEGLGDRPGQARAHGAIGSVYARMAQLDRAVTHHAAQLALAQQLGDRSAQGLAYGSLAAAHCSSGRPREAIDTAQKHLGIAQQLKNEPIQGIVARINLASARSSVGEHQAAIDLAKRALAIAEKLEAKPEQQRAHGTLGLCYARSGQLELACSHFASSDAVAQKLEAHLAEGFWRRHLVGSGDQHIHMLDEWVAAAVRSGSDATMVEALAVEDRRRYIAELLSQAKAQVELGGKACVDTSVDRLTSTVKSLGASFVVFTKKLGDKLLTWVLRGNTGELVYHSSGDGVSIAGRQREIAQWVEDATFVEWGRWQRQLDWARRTARWAKRLCITMDERWWQTLIRDTISADMRGDIKRGLWRAMHTVPKFGQAIARADSRGLLKLRRHFFVKAKHAMARLNDLIWTPIMETCVPMRQELLEARDRCSKPVRRAG